jgi:photosynthetic reaction center cytochrome c subunit
MKIGILLSVVIAALLGIAMLVMPGWDRPPVKAQQLGYRGLGMVEIDNPRSLAAAKAAHMAPAALAPVAPGGPTAGSTFKNVQVLQDLGVGEFTRLMAAMTSWVSPEKGCNYCHNPADLAADIPEKVVARRMLQMTQHINGDWKNHVGATGVTCYTCHRGQPIPANIWFANPGNDSGKRYAGNRAGQNTPSPVVGMTSLPFDPFSTYLKGKGEIRVVSTQALPPQDRTPGGIKAAEGTYGLMMHMSNALGANCTFCHNSRSFFAWDASTPQRVTAWHGIRMVRDLNVSYLEPLLDKYPPGRAGPHGDAPKLNCATCHQGVAKPLYGASMLKDYPELGRAAVAAAQAPAVTQKP